MEPHALYAVAAVSIGLWVLSLIAPVADLDNKNFGPGLGLLFFGWLGPLMLQFGWYANPLLWIAWALLLNESGQSSTAGMVGIGLLITGTNALLWDEIPTGNGSQKVTKLHVGFYLWLASVVGTGIVMVTLGFASPDPASTDVPVAG